MYKNIFMLLSIIIFVSCSNTDERNEIGEKPPPVRTYINEYGIDSSKYKYLLNSEPYYGSGLWFYVDDTLKYSFAGKTLNNKLWIGIYDKSTKKQLFTWTDTEDLEDSIAINEGYGVIKNDIYLRHIYVAYNKAKPIIYLSFQNKSVIKYSYIFTSNNKKILKDSADRQKATPLEWNENNIAFIESYVLNNVWKDLFFAVYNENGNLIYRANIIDSDFPLTGRKFFINNDIAITIKGPRIICKFDYRKQKLLWKKEIDYKTFENIRIDDIVYAENGDSLICTIQFTEYSGSKRTLKFNVNIETGDITYL